MSPRRRRIQGVLAGSATALAIAACGSSSHAGAGSHSPVATGRFPVSVTVARFPSRQSLARRVTLVLAVRNTGTRPVPDVAMSICNTSCAPSDRSGVGTAAEPFAADIPASPTTADPSRPLWIVNVGPGACHLNCNQAAGSGAAAASSNTWALGTLAPGATARFTWALTPVVAGRHTVAWQVAGDLTGRARAVDAGGAVPSGTFRVTVSSTPPTERVTPSGRVVTTAGP